MNHSLLYVFILTLVWVNKCNNSRPINIRKYILETLRARLVIEFKNYCLKRCENCSLKSVIEIHVFSIYKTKKCVWYHGLNNMF